MKKLWHWITQREPLFVAGLAVGVGIFFVLRDGAHAIVAVQALSGTTVALVFGVLRQFVTSPAGRKTLTDAQGDISALPGLVSDMESAKEQLGSLPHGGPGAIAKWFADLAEHHGKNLEAIAEAAKTDIEAMLHGKPVVTAEPPSTEAAPVTLTPVPEPVSEAPTPAEDPELTKLKATIGQ